MKCPEGPLACDMFLSSSSTGDGNRNRNRRVAVVASPIHPYTPPLLSAPANPSRSLLTWHTYDEGVCVCVWWWIGGGGYCHRVHYFVFFSVCFQTAFFFILIKTPALDRACLCELKRTIIVIIFNPIYMCVCVCVHTEYIDVVPSRPMWIDNGSD
jgi:hypothetical protein